MFIQLAVTIGIEKNQDSAVPGSRVSAVVVPGAKADHGAGLYGLPAGVVQACMHLVDFGGVAILLEQSAERWCGEPKHYCDDSQNNQGFRKGEGVLRLEAHGKYPFALGMKAVLALNGFSSSR